jgi:hypothetical protein
MVTPSFYSGASISNASEETEISITMDAGGGGRASLGPNIVVDVHDQASAFNT